MKKITAIGVAAALLASSSAFANTGTLAAGGSKTVTETGTDKCQHLGATASVVIATSKNSVGAWDCASNYIGVGTASEAGSKKVYKGSSMGGKIDATGTACAATKCTTGEAATAANSGSTGT